MCDQELKRLVNVFVTFVIAFPSPRLQTFPTFQISVGVSCAATPLCCLIGHGPSASPVDVHGEAAGEASQKGREGLQG